MLQNQQPFVVLTGPTAVGKTELSIRLAKEIGGEIISADSIQVYKYMDIGSAKITKEEMDGVPHYLVDVLDPRDEFHIVKFQELAKEAMEEIYSHGHIPILVGGTGFYIQGLLYDIDFSESDCDENYRENLEQLANEKGNEYLYEMLKEVDPESAEIIHLNNRKRVIRALEFYQQTGQKISAHNERESKKDSPYLFEYFVLNRPRRELYERIDKRVEQMFAQGLVDEVRKLKEMGYTRDLVSMQGLGYKEVLAALAGEITLDEAKYLIKRDTRHFAKRQLTWFRREKSVTMIDYDKYDYNFEHILRFITTRLRERGIIQ
ncbi:MAG: tRNA (adenosine(37)-N6)-dimethylallyltransferase MiaA [Lachnospiraceae bacterium]|nr:tRNA (adenosine(37)-N6)-dimethylallyltransferase MiaA [Lachnospiraceae bacterium]